MRKIDILNKAYEKIGLDTIVYINKTIDEVAWIDSNETEYKYSDILDGDYNDIIKNLTIGSGLQELTNTIRFQVNVQSLISNIKAPVSTAKVAILFMKIANEIFPPITVGGISVDDVEGSGLQNASGDTYWNVRITKATIGAVGGETLAQLGALMETYLQNNNVEFIYVKSTFLYVDEPSQTQYDNWIETFKSRYRITKETYTLRELFAENLINNGEFDNNDLNNWRAKGNSVNSIINKELNNAIIDASATFGYSARDDVVIEYSKIYASADMKVDTNDALELWLLYYSGVSDFQFKIIDNPLANKWYTLNGMLETEIVHADKSLYLRHNYIDGATANGKNLRMDHVYLFDMISFDEYITKEVMDYIVTLYKQVKYEIEVEDKTYPKTGKSKLDIAYTNKTIDEIVYEGLTLRDIFEHGNIISNPFMIDSNGDGLADDYTLYYADNESVVDGVQKLTPSLGNASVFGLKHAQDVIVGNEFYISIDIKSSLSDNPLVKFEVYTNLQANFIYEDLIDTTYSTIFESEGLAATFYMRAVYSSSLQTDDTLDLSVFIVCDLSIFTINPTTEQMNTWRDMYLARRNLEKIELTYSDIFEIHNLFNIDYEDWSISYYGNKEVIDEAYVINGDGLHNSIRAYTPIGNFKTNDELYINYFMSNTGVAIEYLNYITGGPATWWTDIPMSDSIFTRMLTVEKENENLALIFTFGTKWATNAEQDINYMTMKELYLINTNIFDERITQTQIDTLLAEFKIIRNNIVIPEVFVITEPIGFGKRYKMLSVNDQVYGHELDFEQMQFKVNFGINYNAYDGYNLLITFLKDNEAIIEYDWGKGSRFADVRLLQAPKTEKDTLSLIISKFAWQLLNPFYELLVIEDSSEIITNSHTQDLKPLIEFEADQAAISIKLENQDSTLTEQEIAFDFTGESFPLGVTIDSEKKTIILDDGRNGYDFLDLSKESFLSIVEGIPYKILFTGIVSGSNKVTLKQWVVD